MEPVSKRLNLARHGLVLLSVLGLFIGTTALVRYTGHETPVAINFYYIPIIVSAVAFGDLGAILAAALAAYLTWAYLPRGSGEGEAMWAGWVEPAVRFLFFFIVGVLVSRLTDRARRRAQEFESLFDIAQAVNSSIRLQNVLHLIVISVKRMLGVKGVAIRLLREAEEEGGERYFGHAISDGLSHEYLSKGRVIVEQSPIDQRVLAGETIQLADVSSSDLLQYSDELVKEGIRSMVVVPLVSKGRAIGVMRIYKSLPRRASVEELRLVNAFAEEAGVAIENAGLYESLQESYYETVRALARALEARDEDEVGHAEGVTQAIDALATEAGCAKDEVELLRFGATLHDIGKIGLAAGGGGGGGDDLMAFFGGGDDVGDELLTLHPIVGQSILEPVKFLRPVMPVVLYHHENFDGSGYPEGLAGEEIPLYGRMARVANEYDLLTRRHRRGEPPKPTKEVIAHFQSGAGTEFDPDLVKAFVRVLKRGDLQPVDEDLSG
ncbi:MAG: GAF domain-containing protein [Armatimonadia bacterium]|nr:GAF domain-containing protein [Armatimonadia bacterium]